MNLAISVKLRACGTCDIALVQEQSGGQLDLALYFITPIVANPEYVNWLAYGEFCWFPGLISDGFGLQCITGGEQDTTFMKATGVTVDRFRKVSEPENWAAFSPLKPCYPFATALTEKKFCHRFLELTGFDADFFCSKWTGPVDKLGPLEPYAKQKVGAPGLAEVNTITLAWEYCNTGAKQSFTSLGMNAYIPTMLKNFWGFSMVSGPFFLDMPREAKGPMFRQVPPGDMPPMKVDPVGNVYQHEIVTRQYLVASPAYWETPTTLMARFNRSGNLKSGLFKDETAKNDHTLKAGKASALPYQELPPLWLNTFPRKLLRVIRTGPFPSQYDVASDAINCFPSAFGKVRRVPYSEAACEVVFGFW